MTLWVTPAQRETFDELERKSFRREGGWVPVRQIERRSELDDLVELGLVEQRRPADGDSTRPEPCYRRVAGVPFIVVHPRQDQAPATAAAPPDGEPQEPHEPRAQGRRKMSTS